MLRLGVVATGHNAASVRRTRHAPRRPCSSSGGSPQHRAGWYRAKQIVSRRHSSHRLPLMRSPRHHRDGRRAPAAAPDHGGLRVDAAAPAAALRAGGRPGAGKTIMAGLFIRELLMRADAKRVLIVAPAVGRAVAGRNVREVRPVVHAVLREQVEQSRSGNPSTTSTCWSPASTNWPATEDLQEKLRLTHWDLVVVDEATSSRPTTSATRSTRPSASCSANCWARSPATSC